MKPKTYIQNKTTLSLSVSETHNQLCSFYFIKKQNSSIPNKTSLYEIN